MSRYFNKNIHLWEAAPTSSPNIAHSAWMHARHTLKCDIYKFNRFTKSMLSIHYVSIMMWIFYIDWQQHWECDRTMNIGANAHGERTVSTKQPQVTDLTSVNSWASTVPVTSERYRASFQVTRLFHKVTVSQCDHFFAATYVFVV